MTNADPLPFGHWDLDIGHFGRTGIGAIGTTILGIVLFAESASPARLGCLALVIFGIVGLKFYGGEKLVQNQHDQAKVAAMTDE